MSFFMTYRDSKDIFIILSHRSFTDERPKSVAQKVQNKPYPSEKRSILGNRTTPHNYVILKASKKSRHKRAFLKVIHIQASSMSGIMFLRFRGPYLVGAQPHLYTAFVRCGQSFLCLSDLSTKSNEFSLASSVYNKGNVVLGRLCLVPKNRRHKI